MVMPTVGHHDMKSGTRHFIIVAVVLLGGAAAWFGPRFALLRPKAQGPVPASPRLGMMSERDLKAFNKAHRLYRRRSVRGLNRHLRVTPGDLDVAATVQTDHSRPLLTVAVSNVSDRSVVVFEPKVDLISQAYQRFGYALSCNVDFFSWRRVLDPHTGFVLDAIPSIDHARSIAVGK